MKTKNIHGVSKSLVNPDQTKRALCVFGPLDGKRVEFDNDTTSFYVPVQGEMISQGVYEFTEILYHSCDIEIAGRVWRVFHTPGFSDKEVFQALMDNYIGKNQIKKLKKIYGVPKDKIALAKQKLIK